MIYLSQGYKACHLCFLQQVLFALILFFSCIGWIGHRRQKKTVWVYCAVFIATLLGLSTAIWQIYLQYSPSSHSCGLTTAQIFQFLPLWEALIQLFSATDCAAVPTFFGVPLTIYSAMLFLILLFLNIVGFCREKPRKNFSTN
jgi:disulfide bond formation protein DsbB